jgi:hypothetical protein
MNKHVNKKNCKNDLQRLFIHYIGTKDGVLNNLDISLNEYLMSEKEVNKFLKDHPSTFIKTPSNVHVYFITQ